MFRKTIFIVHLLFLTACNLTDLGGVTLPDTGSNPTGGTVSAPTPTSTPVISPTPVSTIPGSVPRLAATLGIQTHVDLRAFDGPIMDQFGGTCSAFATAAAMNNLLRQKGNTKLVSERHLWDLYRTYDMDVAIRSASRNYLADSVAWPATSTYPVDSLYEDEASLKITQFRTLEYNLNAALQGLNQGHPVVIAVQVPRDLSNCKSNISPSTSSTSGQHVMEAVGYHLDDAISGGGYLILKNSWGSDCGDRGYHYYPFSLCSRSDLYCYFSEIISVEDRSL